MRHFDFARDLRQNPTKAQQTLWYRLRKRNIHGLKFRREHPLGVYVVDFVCLEKKLIVEIDGGQHALQTQYDQRRTAWLAAQGFIPHPSLPIDETWGGTPIFCNFRA